MSSLMKNMYSGCRAVVVVQPGNKAFSPKAYKSFDPLLWGAMLVIFTVFVSRPWEETKGTSPNGTKISGNPFDLLSWSDTRLVFAQTKASCDTGVANTTRTKEAKDGSEYLEGGRADQE